jgi:RNA-directed DNA polymerase
MGLRCQRRSRKWKNHEGESTEAEPRGGTTRSSGEVPETGFTHMCGKTRKTGRFIVKRKTIRKRLSAKLRELKEELRRRWHQPVAEVGKWLKSVVQGYFNYHAVPGNMDSLNSFRAQVIWRWYRALRRRSQRDTMTWERFWRLVDRWIPSAKILHPHPNVRFDARYLR